MEREQARSVAEGSKTENQTQARNEELLGNKMEQDKPADEINNTITSTFTTEQAEIAWVDTTVARENNKKITSTFTTEQADIAWVDTKVAREKHNKEVTQDRYSYWLANQT